MKPIVEEYWDGVVRRLQAEVDIFNRLIGHAGEQGRENELSLARLLENLVPRRLGIGSGIVIDSTGQRSQQTDIIIYDLADQPTIMAQTTQVIFPVEVVFAVVEVKTTLRLSDLEDFASKKQSMNKLISQSSGGPESLLLSYEAWAKPATVARRIYDMESNTRPDGLCVINPGILAGTPAGLHNGTEFRVGLAPLHERDDQGARILGNWRRLKSPPKGGLSVVEGTGYPVTRGPGGSRWLVGEPGRALLLFCEALLRSLALRKGLPIPAWSAYLGDTARELLGLVP